MKKLALLLCGLLVLGGCTQTSSSQTGQPTPAPTLVQTITDPAVLEQFWEEYIDDVSFTIVNGYSSFETIEDISVDNIASFLYLKMQRAGETDVFVDDALPDKNQALFLKKEKFDEYCQRFFNTTADYAGMDETLSDGVLLQNVYTLENLPDVRYNQIEAFPNSELLNVEEYSDGTVVANLREWTVASVDDDTDFLLRKITLQKRDDGSYYFVSASYDFTPTEHVTVEGSYRKLPYHEQYSYGSIYPVGEEGLLSVSLKNTAVQLALYEAKTATKLRELSIPYRNNAISQLKKGENLLLRVDNVFYTLPLDLSKEPEVLSIPLAEEEYLSDITADLTLAVLAREDGVWLVDLASGERTKIPETATYYEEPQNIMTVHGFGNASFVANQNKLLYTEGGYEGFHGFWLYDIATGQKTEIPYGGGYGSTITTTDSGMYLIGVYDRTAQEHSSHFVDFETGEITPISEEQKGEEEYWQAVAPNGDYSLAFRTQIGPEPPYEISEFFIRHAKIGETRSVGCTVTAPSGSVYPLAITAQGKGYVLVSHMGERFVLELR